MSLLIQNKSRSTPLTISISTLFSRSKLATLSLKVQETTNIPAENLRISSESTNPGAVMMSVRTQKNTLLWEGPVPISSSSNPVIINPHTKSVLYGGSRLPSAIRDPKNSISTIHISGLFIIVLLILVWILVFRPNNTSR